MVTGFPTTTKIPPVSQKWKKGKQVGGRAYIPCEWKVLLHDASLSEECVVLIQERLEEVDEEGDLEVKAS